MRAGAGMGTMLVLLGLVMAAIGTVLTQDGRPAVDWRIGQARILTSALVMRTVHLDRSSRQDGGEGRVRPVWDLAVRYTYHVDGIEYAGTTVSDTGIHRLDNARVVPPDPSLVALADRFAAGRTVPVHYDPGNPDRAVLLVGPTTGMERWLRPAGIVVMLTGLASWGGALWQRRRG